MHDYPLEQLGPRAFEQLTVALAMSVIGPGVSAFGSGKDGGREATYEGPVDWSATTGFGEDSWDGYVVIQAKQREHLSDPHNNAVWLKGQINEEFDQWLKSDKRGRFPEYIVFVTNARLSSVPTTGGIDSLDEDIRSRVNRKPDNGLGKSISDRGLRGWKVWHRDQINGLLTAYSGVRDAFPGMLTAGDILSRMESISGIFNPSDLHPVLQAHAWNTISSERWVNFNEAGGNNRQSVENVIVDLRIDGPGGRKEAALREIISRGEQSLCASMRPNKKARHVVLTGQPGNGKSTLSRFLTQVYRAKFLKEDVFSGTVSDIIRSTHYALGRLGVDEPKNCRWPVRVDLAELADDLGPSGDKSLIRWLSEKISNRADINLQPAILKRWFRSWPWMVVFDGLDEVTSLEVRRRIIDEIVSFVEEADLYDADLLAVVTTRPTGYTERVSPEHFEQFDLQYLDPKEAISYGRLVTKQRLSDDVDRRDHVLRRFEKHSTEPAMARLMKTPLQVLIMTFILERLGNLPSDRYKLFWRYYETVYDRETSKNTPLTSLFTDYRTSITELHEAVGMTLQIRSETEDDARALLPVSDLRRMAEDRMREVGYESQYEASRIAEKIVTAATERLVLLVPGEDGNVTFEVRSLQELMAARILSNGTDEEIKDRLSVTAPSPHWRNSWVFAAGRIFSEGPDYRRDLVTQIVETFDKSSDWPGWLCPVGPELAADLLDDGFTAATPRWEKRIIDVALRSVDGISTSGIKPVARGLSSVTGKNMNRIQIRGALKSALSGTPKHRTFAKAIVKSNAFYPPIEDLLSLASGMNEEMPTGNSVTVSLLDLVRANYEALELSDESRLIIDPALRELGSLKVQKFPGGEIRMKNPGVSVTGLTHIIDVIRDPSCSAVMELLFGDLDANQWRAQQLLWETVSSSFYRSPVGQQLEFSSFH